MNRRINLVITLLLAATATAIDPSIYRTCEERDFCNRLRDQTPQMIFSTPDGATETIEGGLTFFMTNANNQRSYLFNVTVLNGGDLVRIQAAETDSERYQLEHVVTGQLEYESPTVEYLDRQTRLTFGGEDNKVLTVSEANMRLDITINTRSVISFNTQNKFNIESDNTSQAFSFDVFFPGAGRAYGIPEHSDRLALTNTTDGDSDPYRLYNVDTPGYETDSKMALYGSVPFLTAHGTDQTVGVFLANAAEQWIDITNTPDGVTAYWMVEGGSLDLFVFLGPRPEHVVSQYTQLTGTPPIPPLWSLGYHQSRLSYLNEDDVTEVVAQFDNNNLPLDGIWGGAWTQDNFKPFTWNAENFNNSIEMLNNISSTQRKFITHVDPHIPIDDGYFVYVEAQENGYFVRDGNDSDIIGTSSGGDSSWLDFFRDDVVEWYEGLFAYDSYEGTNPTLAGIWNDMNEPTVFDDDNERTLDRDAVFAEGYISHRDVHNAYGFAQTRATYEGLLNRDDREIRPFVLTRSFFAGSQRYAAVTTGQTFADWEHLRQTFAMCLSLSVSGISFCGADVGGYFDDPDPELLTRWYQAAAWLPFYRAHAANETQRREPYLYEEEVVTRIRSALEKRYQHLPVFYTLFYENFRYGYPVIRPLFYVYPEDANVLTIDEQIFVGNDILVSVISTSNVTSIRTYFPGGYNQFWYDIDTPLLYRGASWQNVATSPDYIPVYYRGGAIIFKRLNPQKNTHDGYNYPYTVYIFTNENQIAQGYIYQDDYETFAYARREFSYFRFLFDTDSVNITVVDEDLPDTPSFAIGSYVIYRPPSTMSKNNGEPEKIEPIVITKTADGKDLKDIPIGASKQTTIKLL